MPVPRAVADLRAVALWRQNDLSAGIGGRLGLSWLALANLVDWAVVLVEHFKLTLVPALDFRRVLADVTIVADRFDVGMRQTRRPLPLGRSVAADGDAIHFSQVALGRALRAERRLRRSRWCLRFAKRLIPDRAGRQLPT